MGCVQGKPSSPTYNRQQSHGGGHHKLKIDNGYVTATKGGKPNVAQKLFVEIPVKENSVKKSNHVDDSNTRKEGESHNGGKVSREGIGNVSQRIVIGKKIGADEMIDGWPKWLVNNIPKEVLANLVSKTVDSYDKLAKIGHGTYSNVYKARDRDTGKIVALKKVRFDTSEPESVKFMARDIIILQKLDHPNIIKLEGLATSKLQENQVAMKPTLQRKEKAQAGKKIIKTSKVKKSTKRQKGPSHKGPEVLNGQLSTNEPVIETRKEATRSRLEKNGKVVDPSPKIKLQLFPVDEVTRAGLEKDGLNPFLELTLRARKKISSVINHIHTKWGGSGIVAIGDPMLLPYELHLRQNLISSKWTSKDTTITAGDVYTLLESPPVFRLSYGWFSDHEPQRVSTTTTLHNCITAETIQTEIKTTQERKLSEATAQVDDTGHVDTKVKIGQSQEQPISPWENEMTNLSMGGLLSVPSIPQKTILSTDISIGGLLSEASLQGKLNNNNQQIPMKWEDDITNLSIGGLLSEASMQAKMSKFDSKSFISDSFDAILSSQIRNDPQVSILDAEETCHAFSFRKVSSSSKNVRVSVKATQDSSSNPFKFPRFQEVDKQTVHHAEDASVTQPKTQLFPRPQQQYNNEDSRSLGLRGINWNESLGPFDLGNSLPWKV